MNRESFGGARPPEMEKPKNPETESLPELKVVVSDPISGEELASIEWTGGQVKYSGENAQEVFCPVIDARTASSLTPEEGNAETYAKLFSEQIRRTGQWSVEVEHPGREPEPEDRPEPMWPQPPSE